MGIGAGFDMGSSGGLDEINPPPAAFPDSSSIPPKEDFSGNWDWRSALDKHLDDPAFRLDFAVHQSKTAAQAADLSQKRMIDQSSLDLIAADQRENQRHLDELNTHMVELNRSLDHPAPLRHLASMDMAGDLATGVAAAFGAKIPDVIDAGQRIAQSRSDIDYQNQVTQWQVERENVQRRIAELDAQINQATGYGQRLEESRLGQVQHVEDQAFTERQNATHALETATTEAGIRQAQATLGLSDDDPRVKAALSDLSERRVANARMLKQQLLTEEAAHAGMMSPDEANNLQKEFDDLEARYPQVGHHVVINSATWKAKQEADKLQFQKDSAKDKMALARDQLKLKTEGAQHQWALWAAEADFYRQRPDLTRAQQDIEIQRIEAGAGRTANTNVQRAQVKVDRLTAEIKSLDGQIASSTGKAKRTLQGMRARKVNELDGAKSDLDDWNKVAGSAGSGFDVSGGAGALDRGGPRFNTGDTRIVNGKKYRIGQDGQPHLVQ